MYQLEVDCVSRHFGSHRVLTSASLRAMSGQLLLLAGRNGAGKSTLLKIAAGRLRAESGHVCIRGQTVMRPTLATMARRGLFFLPEQQLLTPGLRVGQQLDAVARRFHTEDEVRTVCRSLELDGLGGSTPTQLSVGQLRRASMAFALLRRPGILLADEPIRGIAPIEAERILSAMRELVSRGSAVVVTGHEVPTLMACADAVVWCRAGTTQAFASPAAAFDDWAFQQEFLGAGNRPSTKWSDLR